jgi:hypothetical protein
LSYGIAADSSGNAYVAGATESTNFPTMNPLQPALNGIEDAFVAKISPTGAALVYSTYLGGSSADCARAIALDSSANAYLTGGTSSFDFPTLNPFQPSLNGSGNAFVTKVNAAVRQSFIRRTSEGASWTTLRALPSIRPAMRMSPATQAQSTFRRSMLSRKSTVALITTLWTLS